jgi:hypothetical protein
MSFSRWPTIFEMLVVHYFFSQTEAGAKSCKLAGTHRGDGTTVDA